ncbi:agmatinase family protein [Jeotgalibacillus soli]|uniref:Agmatinase n=1 Tax=Jeotgalibacillus soli TaxID=889306 RepID=A0A0C2RQU3_9BACL|nr:agmatinase family protein [Jeotgalibacillus soli]KIL44104.1 agmatinase [Jeotgalibacillus soli]
MTEKIYGNTPCFLGAVNASDGSGIEESDVIVYGVPWEGAVTWGDYTGCELGPKVMRLSSARYSGYLPELNHIDVFEHLKMGDAGDVEVIPADVVKTMERIKEFSMRIWNSGKFSVALGGDHGITYPIVKGLTESEEFKGKKLGIIHLDAHYDNMPTHNGDMYARSTPFARLYELEGVRNENIIHTGIHGPRNKPESGKYANEAGAQTITINDIRKSKDLLQIADEIYHQASDGADAVYLTICSDVLDYAFNPGGPVDGNGLNTFELLTLIHEFSKKGVVGMDFVEVYPQQDTNDFSSHIASTIVLYVLAGLVENQQKNSEPTN